MKHREENGVMAVWGFASLVLSWNYISNGKTLQYAVYTFTSDADNSSHFWNSGHCGESLNELLFSAHLSLHFQLFVFNTTHTGPPCTLPHLHHHHHHHSLLKLTPLKTVLELTLNWTEKDDNQWAEHTVSCQCFAYPNPAVYVLAMMSGTLCTSVCSFCHANGTLYTLSPGDVMANVLGIKKMCAHFSKSSDQFTKLWYTAVNSVLSLSHSALIFFLLKCVHDLIVWAQLSKLIPWFFLNCALISFKLCAHFRWKKIRAQFSKVRAHFT